MILGAVIAGGAARRFGSDKALATLDGRRLIDHATARLTPHVAAVAICGRAAVGQLALPDRPGPGLGPLGGLAAALHYGAGTGYAAVLTVPCDTPTLDPALLEQLCAEAGAAVVDGCPVVGIWPTALHTKLDRFLADGADRSMRAWARIAGAKVIAGPAPLNINRPEDLDRLRRGWPDRA